MDFSDDDPLADISDGDDSFFDDPKTTKKKSILTKSSSLETKLETLAENPKNDWLGLDETEFLGAKTKKLGKKISFDDEVDILNKDEDLKSTKNDSDDILEAFALGKKSSKAESNKERKISLFDDIMRPPKDSDLKISLDDILKDAKSTIGESKQETVLETKASDPILGLETHRETSRRGRRPSGGILDPLGLFTNKNEDEKKDIVSKTSTSLIFPIESSKETLKKSEENISVKEPLPDLPNWLGGHGKNIKSETTLTQTSIETIPSADNINPKVDQNEPAHELNIESNQMFTSLLNQQKLTQSQMELQNTSINLQQQESQLMMALQLKKYEENMVKMQQQQQEVLVKQEQQFNALLERQFAKQQMIEDNMRLQQERINGHIQLLISQPSTPLTHAQTEINKFKQDTEDERLKYHETMINTLKQRHNEEVFLMEESYKKQLTLLEQSMEALENRLRSDLESNLEKNDEVIKQLQKTHNEELDRYRIKIEEIQNSHAQEIKHLRENNNRILEELKYEHDVVIENIKMAKKSETSILSDSNNITQRLESNIDILSSNSKILQNMSLQIQDDANILKLTREETLFRKEKEIELMRQTLEKCRESAENERAQLLSLVRSLENKIAEQSQCAKEESWAMQQATATLCARTLALDRETEFAHRSIQREQEQLKTLKESMLAEQEKLILQITEEKLALSAERSRLETAAKLTTNFDTQKAKAEIEAAVQIAREATEMADKERETLQKTHLEVESLKRKLQNKERALISREIEVAKLVQSAEKKATDSERAVIESRVLQVKYNDRMKHLQSQLAQLAAREKKIAEEKILLSKERLAINTLAKQTKQCGLCAVEQPKTLDEQMWEINYRNQADTPNFNADSTIFQNFQTSDEE